MLWLLVFAGCDVLDIGTVVPFCCIPSLLYSAEGDSAITRDLSGFVNTFALFPFKEVLTVLSEFDTGELVIEGGKILIWSESSVVVNLPNASIHVYPSAEVGGGW